MKVLIVTQYFWPENFSINSLVQSLVKNGIDVEILTGKPNYPEGLVFAGYRAWGCQTEQWSGVTVHRVPLVPRGARSALKLALNYLSFVVSGSVLAPWVLRKHHYDVIFVYAPSPILQAIPAIFLGWLKKCGVILWVQDLWPESLSATGYVRNERVLGWIAKLVRFIYRRTDLLLVQSRAFEAPVSRLASGTPIVYYPNSVEPQFSASAEGEIPEIPGLDEGFPVVFAGNVGAGQAIEVIVEAAELLRQYPDIRFVIFGNGSRWDWICEEVRKRGLTNLHLPGRFPIETMPGFMQKASALLVTLANQPIFAATVPNKVQAYMATGKPILACVNGEGARLVAEANAGLTVPAEDGQALAVAVLKLYRMQPEERMRMGDNGRRYFENHFDHKKLTDQLIAHFRAVIESGKGRL
ncbi:MAG: glycosyltransferase family 4 protein [Burkholderiaceae bacterium]